MISELFLKDLSLWGFVWQSTLFAVIGLVGSFLLRRKPARASQVLFLAMVAAVLVPTMSVLVKHFELGMFEAEPIALKPEVVVEAVAIDYGTSLSVSPPEVSIGARELASAKSSSGGANIPWRMIVLYGWMMATLILLGRLLVAFVSGVLLLRRAQSRGCEQIQQAADSARARLGITKGLQVRSSKDVRSPVIWCWSPIPVLLVPGDLDHRVDWVGVICHELAHWRRWDHISGLIAELIVCVLSWNPLLWWSKKRMVRLSEQACDDWVVAGGRPCEDYAQSLLNFKPQKQVAFVPAVIHSRRGLGSRVRRILKDSCSNPRAGAVWALAVSIVAACLAIGVACAQTRPAEPATAEAHLKVPTTPSPSLSAEDKAAATAALFRAIRDTNVEKMRLAINQGADLEGKNKDAIWLHGDIQSIGCTPLYVATGVISSKNNLMIELLLEAGANPNTRGPDGQIPLHAAARGDRISRVELLVSGGSDVNAADKKGRTPAIIAFELGHADTFDLMVGKGATVSTDLMSAYKGNLSRVKSLIENGKAQERFEQDLTLLHAAAAGGHTAIVDLLLANGLDVRSKTQAGYTALHHAAAGNHREVAELLLAKGADVNAGPGKPTPLHWAISKQHKDMIAWLLARGANPNADGGDYWGTPLHWAVWWWDVETALLLVSHGGDINLKTQKFPYSPLFDAVLKGNRAMVKALVTKTKDTRAAKWAPLLATVVSGDIQAVEDLLAKGADVNAKGERGWSALHVAAVFGQKDLVELLIEKGADVNAKAESSMWGEGMTALHWSCLRGRKGVAELLIAKGADVNAKSKNGYTPLHVAVTEGYRDVAELLIAKGAYVNAKNNEGETPLSVAQEKGHTEIVELLRKHGAKE